MSVGNHCWCLLTANWYDEEKGACVYSHDKNGNCGFRATSMAVFNDQSKWQEVKAQILQTFIKYNNTLYANRVDDSDSLEKGLSCNLSPCPLVYCFNVIYHPQIAADALVVLSQSFRKCQSMVHHKYKVADSYHLLQSFLSYTSCNNQNWEANKAFTSIDQSLSQSSYKKFAIIKDWPNEVKGQ